MFCPFSPVKLKKKKNIKKKKINYFTADFETVVIDKTHSIFMYSYYGIIEKKVYSLVKDFLPKGDLIFIKDLELILIKQFLNNLKKISFKNNNNIIVYMHNFGSFDGILLLNVLKKNLNIIKNTEFIIRNNSIYKVVIDDGLIEFRDSFKLIPDSLNNISSLFLNNFKKEFYFKIFQNKVLINKHKESLKSYCFQDSYLLYASLYNFNKILFNNFNTSLIESLTISSLSFNIFRKKYYDCESIYNANLFSADVHKLIRESYKGGIVDLYIPYGENLYYYDINSSYPYSMLNYMPTGKPVKLTRDELENFNLEFFFGFLTVEIEVLYTKIPFIGFRNTKIANNIYPYGKFTVSIFSEELKYSLKVNSINILRIIGAVKFQKKKIFCNYVNDIYSKKKNSNSNTEKQIYKLMLNSLYGRFGLKKNFNFSVIVSENQKNYIKLLYDFNVISKLNDNFFLINVNMGHTVSEQDIFNLSLSKDCTKILLDFKKLIEKNLTSSLSAIQISSAITAYARINLDKQKRLILKKKGNIYYSDTDAIVTDLKIPEGLGLGQWRKEYDIKKGYFIAPKVYYLLTSNLNYICKFKGIPKKHIKKLCENNQIESLFKKALNKNCVKYSNTIFKYSINIKRDFKNMVLRSSEELKSINFILHKRKKIFNKNIWSDTEPLYIGDDNFFDLNEYVYRRFYLIYNKLSTLFYIKKLFKKRVFNC